MEFKTSPDTDLELLGLIIKAGIRLTLVGDHRQATFRTNNAKLNSALLARRSSKNFSIGTNGYGGSVLPVAHTPMPSAYCKPWRAYSLMSPRLDLFGKTKRGTMESYALPCLVSEYIAAYSPEILRLDRKTNCDGYSAMNSETQRDDV